VVKNWDSVTETLIEKIKKSVILYRLNYFLSLTKTLLWFAEKNMYLVLRNLRATLLGQMKFFDLEEV